MEQQSLDDSASADNMVSEYFKSTDETYCTHTHTHTHKILSKYYSSSMTHLVT